MRFWDDKRYYSLNYYLKQHYGRKLYKIALDGGMTCPNRDGTCGSRGCIFCSEGGSGDFAGDRALSIREQLALGKASLSEKYNGHSYIAYFQAYTNTYAPVQHLRQLFEEAVSDPEVCVLSIATRPDCLGEDVIELLTELNLQKPVWVELGLQTIHPKSADFIRRGYPLSVFEDAVTRLRKAGIEVIVHTILFLPGETPSQMLDTIRYLNTQDIQGIKLQLLHILKHTDLASYYEQHPFPLPSLEEYLELLGACICTLRPDIVIHRITGDGPKSLLIAPLWTSDKRNVLNQTARYFKEHDIWQGKYTEDDKFIS
ncbi:TIGR01212 family radical SAM protein [Faecalicatena sp. Marseille-Q4148]|nr:TIGR01212 family radical SAM protein [Faecalicatena sp. Marseille-Q4148]